MVCSCIHVSRYCETSPLHQCLFVCRGGGGVWGGGGGKRRCWTPDRTEISALKLLAYLNDDGSI